MEETEFDNLYEDVGNSSTAATTSQPVAPMPVTQPDGDGECLVSNLIVGLMGKVAPNSDQDNSEKIFQLLQLNNIVTQCQKLLNPPYTNSRFLLKSFFQDLWEWPAKGLLHRYLFCIPCHGSPCGEKNYNLVCNEILVQKADGRWYEKACKLVICPTIVGGAITLKMIKSN